MAAPPFWPPCTLLNEQIQSEIEKVAFGILSLMVSSLAIRRMHLYERCGDQALTSLFGLI